MHRSMSADWASGRIMEDAALDILIPTCNRPSELAVTLAGLAAQEAPVFRLVVSDQSDGPPVYDNATVAAIVRVLRAQGGAVELLRHLPRRGLAEHRQFLFDQARAEKVLYLTTTCGWSPERWAG